LALNIAGEIIVRDKTTGRLLGSSDVYKQRDLLGYIVNQPASSMKLTRPILKLMRVHQTLKTHLLAFPTLNSYLPPILFQFTTNIQEEKGKYLLSNMRPVQVPTTTGYSSGCNIIYYMKMDYSSSKYLRWMI
jgi:hypothetical protein